ncbi:MAG: DMT family transporter [Mesorhizobium sp.]|uniref:DMT family transporter n=1 Tax=unclassified Mesorhizobium TaxID=325217 RepID=UPI000FC9BC7F|nr:MULTISPECIES: DMT family transporter [unclassified Mesorhizobium]RUX50717.1 DMT family transporter [Mesorhizobium sp. M4A.F.Ca.ET.050.02.1.1]RVD35089.1 DMT family transporter [Mesorhizobium sp. M4A.F.Ca.ET.020.02.1.1]RWC11886.1 MAG: DMT family transporter [Mesorhizobium sp.]RWD02606.1 MAG: DMT family transporter [Mesorhizobium sp.]RWD27086.1 MAG: DMT family transporter [Mesorhizobium sp.]
MATAAATATARGPMTLADWGQLLLLGAIWGGSFFFARIAVSELSPLVLVLFRVAIAAAALQLYLAVRGPSFRLALPHAGLLFLLALANNVVPFPLIFAGQTELGAGIASVLNATTPFWTLVLANALTSDEKLSWNKLAGIALGIAGTAVMIGPGLLAGLGGPVWAKFALIGASLSYAIALMIARRFKGLPSPVIATGQLTASTIIMIPVVLLAHGPAGLFAASPPVWAAVLGLALLSTAFAYILYFNLVASAGATNASLVTLIVPVSAMLLGFLFLGERLELFEMGGMALIGLGLVTIDGRLFGQR